MNLLQPARERPRDRVQTETDKAARAVPVTIPAPAAGWQEIVNKAEDAPRSAIVAENVFPTTMGVRVRRGCVKAAVVPARVRSLFTYQTASASFLFASTGSAIYNISGLDPVTAPSASVSGLTSGYFSTVQMGTVGGEFLYAVNGTDSARLFDGAGWATITGVSTPAITGVTTSALSFVWAHKNRLWFVQKGTKVAWYLPVDSIGGAAGDFSLAGVFQQGGALLFGCTWSQDAGDGQDDRIVFVSTLGEVAIYQGSNPASASDWALVGLYQLPPPRGPNAFVRAGGDVLIATDDGLIPLSAVTQKDPAALEVAAVSRPIQNTWRRQATTATTSQPWECIKWPREAMMMVSLPDEVATCLVANLQTGAWAKYTGWDVQCMTLFGKALYFGDRSGGIFAAESGGSDNGLTYTARVAVTPSDFGQPVGFKAAGAIRATFLATGAPVVRLSIAAEYSADFPSLPAVTVPPSGGLALWDVGLWDEALWDNDGLSNIARPTYTTGWVSVGASGTVFAPQMQIVIGGTGAPNIELVQLDLLVEAGGSIV